MGEATASALGSPEIGEIQIYRTYAEELLARSVTAWLCTEEEPRVEVCSA
jgi:hypothetical protein